MPTLIYCDPPEAMPITPGSISVGSTPWNFQLDTILLEIHVPQLPMVFIPAKGGPHNSLHV